MSRGFYYKKSKTTEYSVSPSTAQDWVNLFLSNAPTEETGWIVIDPKPKYSNQVNVLLKDELVASSVDPTQTKITTKAGVYTRGSLVLNSTVTLPYSDGTSSVNNVKIYNFSKSIQLSEWKQIIAPYYNQGGTWVPLKKGFVKKDGAWKQFYPSNVDAKILVVGGGGGGGVGYGYEGGGGGGAGGVVLTDYTLSVLEGSSYPVVVGTGGGANESGELSLFGTGGVEVRNSCSPPVYAGTYPVYNGFLNTYGVWTHPGMSGAAPGSVSVTFITEISAPQTYTLRVSADNAIDVSIDGNLIGSNYDWGSYDDYRVDLSRGTHTITCTATNYGGPAMFAAALYTLGGKVVWNTRDPINNPVQVIQGGITALGGGNGGWGTPEQTAGSGASGGGGCGYVYTHSGGAGYPGQGYDGGTGIWQGYGQAGGGGGGGFAGAGQPSNGNQGGNGGQGINILGFIVGGGGGGGYGNQGSYGDGPPGEGGTGGGGRGNGGDAQPNTGGGGGGGLHGAQTSGGRGGSGLVVVQYPGIPLFTGGSITTINGIVTHVFTSSGSLTALA